jgi:hypothetical protein
MNNNLLEHVFLTLLGIHTCNVLHEDGIVVVSDLTSIVEIELLRLNASLVNEDGKVIA